MNTGVASCFFFCSRSVMLRPSVHMLPGFGYCSAGVPLLYHSLLVVDSSCSYNWCLCCHQMEQSWRMWWTVCSASLSSQSESMMPFPSGTLAGLFSTWILWSAHVLPNGWLGLQRDCSLQWPFSICIFDCFGAGFWLPDKWRWIGAAVVCSQTSSGGLLFHFLESHSGLGPTVDLGAFMCEKLQVS